MSTDFSKALFTAIDWNKSEWDTTHFSIKAKGSSTNLITQNQVEAWIRKQNPSLVSDEVSRCYKDIMSQLHIRCNVNEMCEEEEDEVQYIGTNDVLDGFFSHVRIDDSTHIYLIDKFPMKNFHFNTKYDLAYNDEKGGAEISMKDIPSLISTYLSYLASVKNKKLQYTVDITNSIEEYLSIKADAKLHELMKIMKYEKQSVDYLKEFVKATIEDKTLWGAYYKILQHWMWCVKRRALGLNTINQMLIVFTGYGGTGKTYSLDKMVSPFNGHVLRDAKVTNILEERSAAVDSSKLIWILDEMPYASKANIDGLKSWVTAEETIYRPMGTNNSVAVKKRSMAIGSQNKPLGSTIQDPTGNRRFVDYPIKQGMNEYIDVYKPEHKYYEQFQSDEAWISIWKNVDETLERGYVDLNGDSGVDRILNSNYTSSIEYSFYKDVLIGDETITIRRSIFFEMYKKYVMQSGNKPKANNTFTKDFESMCSAVGLDYNVIEGKSVMVEIPKLNIDYRTLFRTIPDSTPAILLNDENMFKSEDLYHGIKVNTKVIRKIDNKVSEIQDGYKAIEY